MIGAGLPASANDWPPGVLEALQQFSQGDLIRFPPLAYLTDPAAPVWEESRRFAVELSRSGEPPEPEIITFPDAVRPPYGMIVSQTCDIVEEDTERPVRPWVQVVPVYDGDAFLSRSERSMQRNGRGTARYLHIPALVTGFYVADLRISFPVEKGWLARQVRIDGFGSEQLRQRVGDRLAAVSGRPAFGGDFVEAIQRPLRGRIRGLKQANKSLYDEVDAKIPELGIRLDSRLHPTSVQLVVLCDRPVSEELHEWWLSALDSIRPGALAAGITVHALEFMELDLTSAADYRKLTILPMVNVTP